jgi:hypothetical protein
MMYTYMIIYIYIYICFIDYGSVSAAQGVYKAASQGFWIYDSHVRVVYAKPKDVKAAGPAAEGIGSGAPPKNPPPDNQAHATAAFTSKQVPEGFTAICVYIYIVYMYIYCFLPRSRSLKAFSMIYI